jgi:hypothetical protein
MGTKANNPLIESGRFEKLRTRYRKSRTLVFYRDRMTGHIQGHEVPQLPFAESERQAGNFVPKSIHSRNGYGTGAN